MNNYAVIGKNGEELHAIDHLHPGEVLQEEIEARKIKKFVFASRIGILPSHLSDLFAGKRNISARLALKIEKELGVSAEIWMRLQVQYDLDAARRELEMV